MDAAEFRCSCFSGPRESDDTGGSYAGGTVVRPPRCDAIYDLKRDLRVAPSVCLLSVSLKFCRFVFSVPRILAVLPHGTETSERPRRVVGSRTSSRRTPRECQASVHCHRRRLVSRVIHRGFNLKKSSSAALIRRVGHVSSRARFPRVDGALSALFVCSRK